jgi:hypothetical protein
MAEIGTGKSMVLALSWRSSCPRCHVRFLARQRSGYSLPGLDALVVCLHL